MEKIKENKWIIIVTMLVTLLPILVGIILWDKLPNEIATHFNADGVADGWSSKLFAVVGLPGFLVIVQLICACATMADPKYERVNPKVFKMILWIIPVVSWFCSVSIYTYALGVDVDMNKGVKILMGVLFVVVGNYLPKCRQNYTVGIKLPWTLDDEDNWNKTHRLAGFLWMLCGTFIIINAFTNIGGKSIIVILFFVMVLVPMVFSYWYYQKMK